jgi:anti-sigma factor RsiW
MSKQTKHNYDEVTFALYYDYELDSDESTQFEHALEQDPTLLKAYEDWVSAFELLSQNFEALEDDYDLEGFSQKVMNSLPNDPWPKTQPAETVHVKDSVESEPWWAGWFKPILIGTLAAAAVLIVARSIQTTAPTNQRSTVLINYPDQTNNQEEAPVIWLLDEEESIEDLEPSNDKDDEEDI